MLAVYAVLGAGLLFLSALAKREVSRSLGRLSQQHCPACDTPYGHAVAVRARNEYIAECEESRRAEPAYLINFAREWRVTCPTCHASSYYGFETDSLTAPSQDVETPQRFLSLS